MSSGVFVHPEILFRSHYPRRRRGSPSHLHTCPNRDRCLTTSCGLEVDIFNIVSSNMEGLQPQPFKLRRYLWKLRFLLHVSPIVMEDQFRSQAKTCCCVFIFGISYLFATEKL